MQRLWNFLSNADQLLALEPEELAGVVLEMLNSAPANYVFTKDKFALDQHYADYPQAKRGEIQNAVMEAWAWLEREGMLVSCPGRSGEYFLSRRAKKFRKRSDLDSYRHGDMLPKRMLHSSIAQKVWATFLRGDYDTAVFQSFKEVEVAVRAKAGYPDNDIGVPMMRKAFHPATGPLTDKTVVASEQQAIADLFAGAMGSYKNPHSHRSVSIDAEQAVEMIILASHLLKIVEERP